MLKQKLQNTISFKYPQLSKCFWPSSWTAGILCLHVFPQNPACLCLGQHIDNPEHSACGEWVRGQASSCAPAFPFLLQHLLCGPGLPMWWLGEVWGRCLHLLGSPTGSLVLEKSIHPDPGAHGPRHCKVCYAFRRDDFHVCLEGYKEESTSRLFFPL